MHEILPNPNEPMYLVTEDSNYAVYEGYLEEIVLFVGECVNEDFYLVSKKMAWLVSEHHHAGVVFSGETLRTERFDYGKLTKDTFGEHSNEYEDFKRGRDVIRQ